MIMSMINTMIITNMFFITMMLLPTPIIILIIIQTLLISLILSLNLASSWLPIMLLLILFGGLMVLFIYMTSLTPNKNLLLKTNLYYFMVMAFMYAITLLISYTLFEIMSKKEIMMFTEIIPSDTTITMANLFSSNNQFLTIFMALYLLMTMVIIIKITLPWQSPMQLKN